MLQIEKLVKTVSLSGFLKGEQTVINLQGKLLLCIFKIPFLLNINRRNLIMACLSCTIKRRDKIDIKCKINEESYLSVCECVLSEQLSLFRLQ